MNFEEYQELARRTQSKDMTDNDRLYHALFGMCSEVGYHADPWVWVIEFERCEKPEKWCDNWNRR